MKPFFIILLLILINKPACVFGQAKNKLDSIKNKLDSLKLTPCIMAFDSAYRQVENGKYYYTIMGTIKGSGFDGFYYSYMKQKYNVTIRGLCTGTESEIEACYVSEANRLVEEKYGKDFLRQTREEARSLYKK